MQLLSYSVTKSGNFEAQNGASMVAHLCLMEQNAKYVKFLAEKFERQCRIFGYFVLLYLLFLCNFVVISYLIVIFYKYILKNVDVCANIYFIK